MNIKELDEIMNKLQQMFDTSDMESEGVFEWFDETITNLLGKDFIYYATWDMDWVSDDWVYDIQEEVINHNKKLTALGSYEIGKYDDKVIVVCYK